MGLPIGLIEVQRTFSVLKFYSWVMYMYSSSSEKPPKKFRMTHHYEGERGGGRGLRALIDDCQVPVYIAAATATRAW